MIAVAPHHLIYTYLIYSYKALDIVKLVWAAVLSVPKAMREPENEIRQYVPTPFYFITAYHREQVSIGAKLTWTRELRPLLNRLQIGLANLTSCIK